MKKFTLKYVQNYFKEQECELIENKYKNSTTRVKYKCSCGEISTITFNDFKKGRRCWACGLKKRANNRRHTYEYVKSFFEDNGCELLETKYTKNNVKMRYQCNCGNIGKINFNNFKSGKRCNRCGTKRTSEKQKHTFLYVYNFFKNNKCQLLENEYLTSGTKMKYRCICGNIDKIKFNHFKNGHRCRKCGIDKISGKNHHNYNPELTDEERGIKRDYPEYIKWRKEVYGRDDYTCQKCKQKGHTLNAHHMLNYSNNKSLRTDISNGITLCKKCHVGFHKKYGKSDNNQKQLDKYL